MPGRGVLARLVVVDIEITRLVGLDRGGLAALLGTGPDHDCGPWWSGLLDAATIRAIHPGTTAAETYLTLVVDLAELAVENGALTDDDRVVRLTNLAAVMAGSSVPVPVALRPVPAVGRCLDAAGTVGLTPAAALRMAVEWRSQPIDRLHRLRLLKRLLSPLRVLRPHLPLGHPTDTLDTWLAVLPALP